MNNLTDDKRMLVYGPNSLHTDIFCFSTTRHGVAVRGIMLRLTATIIVVMCPIR
mgnify:CR=1 FL=1